MKRVLSVAALCILLAACASAPMKTTDLPAAQRSGVDRVLEVRTTGKGVTYFDMQEGTGDPVQIGTRVFIEYSVMFDDGLEFETSKGDKPLIFRVGSHKTLAGVEDGVLGMKVGGKRRLIIPPSLAYGSKGIPGTVPPDATLMFDMELLRAEQ